MEEEDWICGKVYHSPTLSHLPRRHAVLSNIGTTAIEGKNDLVIVSLASKRSRLDLTEPPSLVSAKKRTKVRLREQPNLVFNRTFATVTSNLL